MPALHELDPRGVLVHVVRDPRAVAASIVLGAVSSQRRSFWLTDAEPSIVTVKGAETTAVTLLPSRRAVNRSVSFFTVTLAA